MSIPSHLRSALALVAAVASAAFAQQSFMLEKASDLSDPMKVQRTEEALARMKLIQQEIHGKLDEARNTRDVVKLNCVSEKLSQARSLIRVSEKSLRTLKEAVQRKRQSAAELEYTKVSLARAKAEQLRAEAEECIGQLAYRTDENLTVEVEAPTGLPKEDPTSPKDPGDIINRPPQSSPIQ